MDFKNDKNVQRAIIIENYENPNKKVAENFSDQSYTSKNFASNSCIDNLTLFLKISDEKIITDAVFNGTGCAVSTASTNIFCNTLINKKLDEALVIIKNYELMIKGEEYDSDVIAELNVLADIKNQPNRYNCAMIAPSSIKLIISEDQ
ncbi:MAG: iron-sulfur cluster assembly scaffold protein [Mycoplasmoidaceae bacterium]